MADVVLGPGGLQSRREQTAGDVVAQLRRDAASKNKSSLSNPTDVVVNKNAGRRRKKSSSTSQPKSTLETPTEGAGSKTTITIEPTSESQFVRSLKAQQAQDKRVFETKSSLDRPTTVVSTVRQRKSGTGLSPSQQAKRDFLVKTGAFEEKSQADKPFKTVEPLPSILEIGGKPDKKGFVEAVRGEQQRFDTTFYVGEIPKERIVISSARDILKLEKQSLSFFKPASPKEIGSAVVSYGQYPLEIKFGRLGVTNLPFSFGVRTGSAVNKPTDYTIEQITSAAKELGYEKGGVVAGTTAAVISEFIPKTAGDYTLAVGLGTGLAIAPPVARISSNILFGSLGTKTALDTDAAIEKRIAGGIGGGLAFTAAGIELYPYLQGGFASLFPATRRVTKSSVEEVFIRGGKDVYLANRIKSGDLLGRKAGTFAKFDTFPEGVYVIRGVKGSKGKFDIGIIPEGSPLGTNVPEGTPAFLRGGFGFTKAEQNAIIGQKVTVVSGQQTLFKGQIGVQTFDRLFFSTPSTKAGQAQVRISRTGGGGLFDYPTKTSKLSFKPSQPRIAFMEDVVIGTDYRTGFKGGYAAKGVGTSELEVVTTRPMAYAEQPGFVFGGKYTRIFKTRFIDSVGDLSSGEKLVTSSSQISSSLESSIPLPSVLSPAAGRGGFIPTSIEPPKGSSKPTTQKYSIVSRVTTTNVISSISSDVSSPISSSSIIVSSPTSGRKRGGSKPSSPISYPSSPIISPVSPSPSRGSRSISYPSYITSRINRTNYLTPQTTKIEQNKRIPPFKSYTPKISSGAFGVQVRRGGKFFNIGTFGTAKQAFEAGRLRTSETLAATFKVTTPSQLPKSIKGYYTRRTKEGTLFIELPKYRLSKRKEKEEIQLSRKKKRKKKR